MAVPRARKKTRKELMRENGIPQENEQRMIMNASWMVLACTGIYPGSDIRFGQKAMNKVITAYWETMAAIHDENVKRCTAGLPGITPREIARRADEALNLGIEREMGRRFMDSYKLNCNLLTSGCMVIALGRLGWRYTRILRWLEGYLALIDEVGSRRQATTARSIYDWCYELTGIRVNEKVTWDGRMD